MGIPICEDILDGGRKIALHKGDLTAETVDAIVNAANAHLAHGGGVAAAIVRCGGPEIQEQCSRIVDLHGPVPVGKAVATGSGRLPCKAVIHTVGPRWGEGDEDARLTESIRSCLNLAADRNYTSIAFPAVSSGIFGFPKDRCAKIFWKTAHEWFRKHLDASIREIRFTLIDDPSVEEFKKAWEARKAVK